MSAVPQSRILKCNDAPVNPKGDFVLYWMIAFRRTRWNFSLQRATEWCLDLSKPLIVFEPLRAGYAWASDRFHRFIMDGMKDNRESLKKANVFYYPYVEQTPDAAKGLLAALAKKACVVVTDDFPAFFLPRMTSAVANTLPVHLEKVDSNGLLPMRAADTVFTAAQFFRRFLQKELPTHLSQMPEPEPLKGKNLPAPVSVHEKILRWRPPASPALLQGYPGELASIPLDHGVSTVEQRGGTKEGTKVLRRFLKNRLSLYPDNRNHPDEDGTSGLSPYLHFGHISPHEVFHLLAEREEWSLENLSRKVTGSRSGWWRMSEAAEAFLDELVTWREMGFNMCSQRDDYDRYESLPDWALTTLRQHEKDRRKYLYSLDQFEKSETHDALWNAAQTQLRVEGRIHNYLRMLWGKKILEWTPSPQDALEIMIELNNKYALDGRDPNSYTGIMWILGRYDRAWGPERSIFGKVRYMSCESTLRKVKVHDYLEKYRP